MVDRLDIAAADDDGWEQAVQREAVIRRLTTQQRISRSDFLAACRELGVKRSRLYELIRAYKARPLTSSLLASSPGTQTGSRRLPDEIEAVVSEAIDQFFKSPSEPEHQRASQRGSQAMSCKGAEGTLLVYTAEACDGPEPG